VLSIGNLTLPFPCVLAPIAGVSDLPFRMIARAFGCPFAFTEMIDATAIGQRDKRTRHMLSSSPDDRPLGVQLLGNDEKHILAALDLLEPYGFDVVDFNAACPTPKVTRRGKGAALLKEPHVLRQLLATLVAHSTAPVTVKIRTGWDIASVNAKEIALYAEDAGIAALFIHGRTKSQGYGGEVDYSVIRDVKEALKIPVIASGDNLSAPMVKKMFDETGCDGVAIARGSFGSPWIFKDIAQLLADGRTRERPGIDERIETMKAHLDLAITHHGEKRGVASFHKFFIWYTRGLSGMKPLRDKAFRIGTAHELIAVIEEIRTLQDQG
jgi:tRNA-dihydrouridine synthase B